MTKIEQNSFSVQLELANDIISNFSNINYHIEERGKEMITHLSTKKISENEKTVTLSKDVFDKLLDIGYMLSDRSKWDRLGILAKSAVSDNETKRKILHKLQSS